MQTAHVSLRQYGNSAPTPLNSVQPDAAPEVAAGLTEALKDLVRLRDELIACQRRGEDCSGWLNRTNALISSGFGTDFPVSGLQWKRVRETRDGLAELLAAPPR